MRLVATPSPGSSFPDADPLHSWCRQIMASIATLGSAACQQCFVVLLLRMFLKQPVGLACRTEDLVNKISLKDVPEFMKLQDSSGLKVDS